MVYKGYGGSCKDPAGVYHCPYPSETEPAGECSSPAEDELRTSHLKQHVLLFNTII